MTKVTGHDTKLTQAGKTLPVEDGVKLAVDAVRSIPNVLEATALDILKSAFEDLRRYVTLGEGGINWKSPSVQLELDVDLITKEDLEEAKASSHAVKEMTREDVYRVAMTILESLPAYSLKAITGPFLTVLEEDGERGILIPDALAEEVKGLPEAERDAKLIELGRGFELPDWPFSGTVGAPAGKQDFKVALVFAFRPLHYERKTGRVFFPILVGLNFTEGDPSAWPPQAREELWTELSKAVDELAASLKEPEENAGRFAAAMEVALRALLVKAAAEGAVTPEAVTALQDWIKTAATPEALGDWLEKGGCKKVNIPKLEMELPAANILRESPPREWLNFFRSATGPNGNPPEASPKWLRLTLKPWIKEAAERLERTAHAVAIAIRPKARTQAGNQWTPLPRALEAAAALGGSFEWGGETYALEPDMAGKAAGHVLRPRRLDIVPADWLNNPAQMCLALDLNAAPEAVREYMIETAARTATLARLPNMCPKLLGFMFAAAPMTGRPVKGTLLELARYMYSDWSRRRQNKRDLQGLGAAFVAVKSLRLVEIRPDGTRHPYDLFTIDYDLSCKPNAEIGFMLNPWLVERMKGGSHGGYFMLNMTRWLALGIQNPRLFPLALRLAALWDKARKGGIYDPANLRPIEADRLAVECNTLPEGAAMYLTRKTDAHAAHVALKTARANMEDDLNALREAGLLGPWEKRKVYGKGFTVLPVPPDDYAEACKKATQASRTGRRNGKP